MCCCRRCCHAGEDGEGLERQLLADVGARGTESSCKSLFVAALLDELVAAGHRTLVFSQSRVMLDILQVRGECAGAQRRA
jgi:SNF2 family DNA or RNA helicase